MSNCVYTNKASTPNELRVSNLRLQIWYIPAVVAVNVINTSEQEKYCSIYAGYDKQTHTLGCGNCGSQYMFGRPTGEVKLRPDGTPCTHEYVSKTVGKCYHRSECIHCGDAYHIDSGD